MLSPRKQPKLRHQGPSMCCWCGFVQDRWTPTGHPAVPQLSSQWIFSKGGHRSGQRHDSTSPLWWGKAHQGQRSTPDDRIKPSILVGPEWAIAHILAMPSMVYTLPAKPLLSPWGYSAPSSTSLIALHPCTNAFLFPDCNHHQTERPFLADVPLLPCLPRCKLRRQETLP